MLRKFLVWIQFCNEAAIKLISCAWLGELLGIQVYWELKTSHHQVTSCQRFDIEISKILSLVNNVGLASPVLHVLFLLVLIWSVYLQFILSWKRSDSIQALKNAKILFCISGKGDNIFFLTIAIISFRRPRRIYLNLLSPTNRPGADII